MNSIDEHSGRSPDRTLGDTTRGLLSAVCVGATCGLIGTTIAALLLPLVGDASYAPLVGAVAVAVWAGGGIGGTAAVVAAWTLGFWVLAEPRGSSGISSRDEFVRWVTSLVVGVIVVGAGFVMRRGYERAAEAAELAEQSRTRVRR